MSDKPVHSVGRGNPVSILPIGIAALTLAGIVYLLVAIDREVPLNRSPVGFAGLTQWLKSQEIEALTFQGGGALKPEDIALRILPLFDTDLANESRSPTNETEDLNQTTEVDISAYVVNQKIQDIPTLVVLPKWRRAVRLKGVAHPDYLIPGSQIQSLSAQIDGLGGILNRAEPGFSTYSAFRDQARHEIGLYHSQVLSSSGCDPLIGGQNAMLLGECRADGSVFWILADPDLLNNHGLKLSENAHLARDLITELVGGGRVIVDLSTSNFIADSPEPDKRSWTELARFFTGVFAAGWIGLALVAGLLVWRASTRYGPAIKLFEDRPIASKTSSIDATARLLRLSGHDLELLKSHVAARCRILAADLLGPHRGVGADPVRELAGVVSRRSPDLAEEISLAAHDLNDTKHDWSDAEMLRFLDRFESLYERTLHEFGRSADARAIHSR